MEESHLLSVVGDEYLLDMTVRRVRAVHCHGDETVSRLRTRSAKTASPCLICAD